MAEYFTQKCEICGKEIVTHGAKNWGYKIKLPKGPYKFFCSYKCQRKYEKEYPEKKVDVIAQAAAEEAKKPKKMPTERGCIARSLIDVIRAGEDPIKYLQKQGYKNPYEAYSSVRHYCETNEPHLTEVLKPLKELRKAEVRKVDKVPDIEQLEEQVAEVLNAEEEAPEKQEETMADPHPKEVLLTLDYVLRTVDEAALECQDGRKEIVWGSNDTIEQTLFRGAKENAVKVGVMKLRNEIRQKLGVAE